MPTESTFLLAGLFVIAAAIGWLFARLPDFWRDERPESSISADYLRGLNLVLNRQTDEALELFVRMAKVDDETLETHFALGHLFRRRGEVDRAIRVHQNLLARPNLSEIQRHQALFSLARDYLGAGLFDRAEKLFAELRSSPTMAVAALRNLVDIYERQRDWDKAIEMRRKLDARTGEKSVEVAHYYCELAERARLDGDMESARQHLKNSRRSASGTLRGALIRAAIAREEGNHSQAVTLYKQLLTADRRLMAEILPLLEAACRETGRDEEIERYLRGLIGKDGSIKRDIAYAAITSGLEQAPLLRECVEEFLLDNDTLAPLIDIEHLRALPPDRRQASIQRICGGLRQLAMSGSRYRCTGCGYSTKRLLWHCPSCKSWESIRPVSAFQFTEMVA